MSYYTSIIIMVILALGVLCVLILENDRIPREKKRIFLATNILIALAAAAECAGVNIGEKSYIPSWVLALVKAADYTLTPMTGGALIALMRKPGKKHLSFQWIFIVNAVFQIVSAFNGWMIVIDNRNHYTHGPLYPVYMILYSVVLVTVAVRLVSYGKSFRKQNRVSLYATVILIFVGIGIQEIMGSAYRVAYIALAFGSAFLFIHFSEFSQLEMDDQISEQRVKISKDALTGVFSRFAYVDAIKEYADHIPNNFTVFLIDINGLKQINDSLGHEAGDELICGAARCIETTIGKCGRTFRIGGDEFVVFTSMNKQQADSALKDLHNATKKWSGKKSDRLGVCAGYALAKDYEGYSIEELTKEADKAMYEQKKEFYQQHGMDRRKSPTIMKNL